MAEKSPSDTSAFDKHQTDPATLKMGEDEKAMSEIERRMKAGPKKTANEEEIEYLEAQIKDMKEHDPDDTSGKIAHAKQQIEVIKTAEKKVKG